MKALLQKEILELLCALFIMTVCAVMMFCGIDGEVKTVFIMGAVLAIRAGFDIKGKVINNAGK